MNSHPRERKVVGCQVKLNPILGQFDHPWIRSICWPWSPWFDTNRFIFSWPQDNSILFSPRDNGTNYLMLSIATKLVKYQKWSSEASFQQWASHTQTVSWQMNSGEWTKILPKPSIASHSIREWKMSFQWSVKWIEQVLAGNMNLSKIYKKIVEIP